MSTFDIEIRETLSRVVNVEAENQKQAIAIVEESYQKEEIVLDYSDFKNLKITPFRANEEKDDLIREIIHYLYNEEKKHFEESDESDDHIFLTLEKLKALVD